MGGVGETENLVDREEDLVLCDVSPDEVSMLVHQTRPGTSRDLMILTMGASVESTAYRETAADERCGSFSPDGRWIAYTSNESGRYEIYVAPFPWTGRRWQVSEEGGLFPQWRSDGREIVYTRQNGELVAAAIEIGTDSLQPSGTQVLFRIHPPIPSGASFALAPDGEKLLVWSNKLRESETVVNLVVNWPAELD